MSDDDLGYNQIFENDRNRLGFADFFVARVISEYKEAYRVKNTQGEYLAKITGKQMFQASGREDYPAVGDWVAITELGNEQATINGILPRQSIIKRKYGDKNKFGEKNDTQIIATNIDVAFVVETVNRDYNLNRFERYFAIAEGGGVKPAIILNKVDLLLPEELNEKLAELKNRFPGIDIIASSTIDSSGLNELKDYLEKGKTYCFLGSSGVGKSSLINKLLGDNMIKTGEIGTGSDRGKHTTTNRQMYFLENGGIVIDNPGIREVGLTDTGRGVDDYFEVITALAKNCKYADCTHTHEPGCEVIRAAQSGKLDQKQYENYLSLKKEVDYFEKSDYEKKEDDRQFGKFKKQAKKDLRDFGY